MGRDRVGTRSDSECVCVCHSSERRTAMVEAPKWSIEEYMRSACEDLKCDFKTL
jgi:hypothetical protein